MNATAYPFIPGEPSHLTYPQECVNRVACRSEFDAVRIAPLRHYFNVCSHRLVMTSDNGSLFFNPETDKYGRRRYVFKEDILNRDLFTIRSMRCLCELDDIAYLL